MRSADTWRNPHVYDWAVEHRVVPTDGVGVSDAAVLRHRQVYDADFPATWRAFVVGEARHERGGGRRAVGRRDRRRQPVPARHRAGPARARVGAAHPGPRLRSPARPARPAPGPARPGRRTGAAAGDRPGGAAQRRDLVAQQGAPGRPAAAGAAAAPPRRAVGLLAGPHGAARRGPRPRPAEPGRGGRRRPAVLPARPRRRGRHPEHPMEARMSTGTRKVHTSGTHRTRAPEETWEIICPRFERYGITRVSDVTGLDHLGIPVAMATRPLSWTLSVSQGKGQSLLLAKVSAAMEGIEFWHAERVRPPVTHRAVAAADLDLPYDVREIGMTPSPFLSERTPLDWVDAVGMETGQTVPVPIDEICFRDPAAHRWSPVDLRPSSNGLASGNCREEAALHALYEVIERDALSRPTLAEIAAAPSIDPSSVPDPVCAAMVEAITGAGGQISIALLPSRFGVPTFKCLVWSLGLPGRLRRQRLPRRPAHRALPGRHRGGSGSAGGDRRQPRRPGALLEHDGPRPPARADQGAVPGPHRVVRRGDGGLRAAPRRPRRGAWPRWCAGCGRWWAASRCWSTSAPTTTSPWSRWSCRAARWPSSGSTCAPSGVPDTAARALPFFARSQA
ncbi:hypothetical protein G5V59_13750 [Nocardioides sp. W3-2-3]|uniref:YcaO-like family protein n=1 Tax=Nocardioides convexus TaxID=2712224 RepID=UPI0024182F5C|nr:YcaO-like family protein [Nocardioides convexus]NHA00712.1 hypothetical protein [Nocardioides convexus]